MPKRVTRIVVFAGVLIVFGAAVVWFVLRPQLRLRPVASTSPICSVTFSGYTNDTSGVLLTRFAITNLSDIKVARSRPCVIDVPGNRYGLQWIPHSVVLLSGRLLDVGGWEMVTIKAPTTLPVWRASFYISNEHGVVALVNRAFRLIRQPSLYPVSTRQVDSERIEWGLTNEVRVEPGDHVHVPGLKVIRQQWYSTLPPPRTAETNRSAALTPTEAQVLAVKLANQKAREIYKCEPFLNGLHGKPAQLVQGWWVWHDRQGQGTADVEGDVRFAPDGSNPDVRVTQLYSGPGDRGF